MYLALNQGTAEWLLPKIGLIETLRQSLAELTSSNVIKNCDFVEGPIRISQDSSGQVLAIWHIDYLSGTGDEPWAFLKLDGDVSLESIPSISHEVLEREIYLASQRLQGLLVDAAFYHRKYDNGAHTLLAGRGSTARQYSIGYFERSGNDTDSKHRSLICIGPSESFSVLSASAEQEGRLLPRLIPIANRLLTSGRGKEIAPAEFLASLRSVLGTFAEQRRSYEFENVEVVAGQESVAILDAMKAIGLTYAEWTNPSGPLSDVQRRVLQSDSIDRHPLRILGPGGSGKTVLMQLLAIRKAKQAADAAQDCRILYVVHNEAMCLKVTQRFGLLLGENIPLLGQTPIHNIEVSTLGEYCRLQLGLDMESVIDPDATDAKAFQLQEVVLAIKHVSAASSKCISSSKFLAQVFASEELMNVFSWLVLSEISIAIKGHGLEQDKKRYVESERSLSRFHGILERPEREFVFEVFKEYHRSVFETYGVLDPDDIALSLAGRLRTPVWQLRRRVEGFDYIFVDEAQLFNENERRVLPLLTKGTTSHVPIALALDEAQSFYGSASAGLATLGIKDITNESLVSIHRSTTSIIKLAFFVIQRSTDLFGPDFPDFTGLANQLESDAHPLAAKPSIETASADTRNIGKFVLRRVRELRKSNIRQIAVICHAEQYWSVLESELSIAGLPFQVIRERGERIRHDQPLVLLVRPAQVGGQEFDAVVIVGLELGLVPPRVVDNEALSTAIEQQTLREMYLSVTRARYRVTFAMAYGAAPNLTLEQARQTGLIV